MVRAHATLLPPGEQQQRLLPAGGECYEECQRNDHAAEHQGTGDLLTRLRRFSLCPAFSRQALLESREHRARHALDLYGTLRVLPPADGRRMDPEHGRELR